MSSFVFSLFLLATRIKDGHGASYSFPGPFGYQGADNINGEFTICENITIEFDLIRGEELDNDANVMTIGSGSREVLSIKSLIPNVLSCSYPDYNEYPCNPSAGLSLNTTFHYIYTITGSIISLTVDGTQITPVGSASSSYRYEPLWLGYVCPLYKGGNRVQIKDITIETSGDCTGAPAPTVAPSVPTLAPTNIYCGAGRNYVIAGIPAISQGDPHITTWNGDKLDFMGSGNDQLVYYMHPCKGFSKEDVPFTMIARHLSVSSQSITVLDYIVLELFDRKASGDIDLYLLWISPKLGAMLLSTVLTTTQRLYGSNTDPKTSISGTGNIGETFSYNITHKNVQNRIDVELLIGSGSNSCSLVFYLVQQTTDSNHLMVTPPKCYICYLCGLLGDFSVSTKANTGRQALKGCNGQTIVYDRGASGSNAAAYDVNGLTWDITYNNCPNRRRLIEEEEYYYPEFAVDFEYINRCDETSSLYDDAQSACSSYQKSYICDALGSHICDNFVSDCAFDVCVILGNTSNITSVEQVAQKMIGNVFEFFESFGSDTISELFDEGNIIAVTSYETTTFSTVEGEGDTASRSSVNIIISSICAFISFYFCVAA
eukprot:67044_1